MQELLYRAGASAMWAGLLSLLFCFALFGGRLILGVAVEAEGRFRVYEVPEFNYAWFRWSLAVYFVGCLLTGAALINNPELAARVLNTSAPAGATARLFAEILRLCFDALLYSCALMIVDALHHPERGLGRFGLTSPASSCSR